MKIGKYKYYFRKPKSEIAKDIFTVLLTTGLLVIAAQSPYFVQNMLASFKKWKRYSKKKVADTFYQLKHKGFITIEERSHQIYIALTPQGKKRAGWLQIDALRIAKPPKWDGKWRILLFDIAELKKVYREALRGKLKELDFYQFQKSVWVYPYNCEAEVELLKDFFGLSNSEIRLIVTQDIGEDQPLRQYFSLIRE